MTSFPYPQVRLRPKEGRRLRAGAPWAFSNEIAMTPEAKALPPGSLVRLEGDDGGHFGVAMFNPHSLIAARVLDTDPAARIDGAWMRARLAEASALRARMCDGPFHRLVHAEGDRLPGLILDRFGDAVVLQANSAGMERLTPLILEALDAARIVARNDASARSQEGLPEETSLLRGEAAQVEVVEGDVRFPVDLMAGQKTGWFFDQRPNRDLVASLAGGARVLDLFCHTGAFGLRCARAGAASVTLVDSSAPALALAEQAAALNGLAGVTARRGDVFDVLGAFGGERFDLVICDPPAFAKSRKDAAAGLRAYGKLARMAAAVVAPGGFLFTASCSHHAPLGEWSAQIAWGLHRAGREARLLATTGAGPDHPVHPQLPETAYLKGELLQVV
jgi:23S rRNA (cytosine1962-C5)-methyltransferase